MKYINCCILLACLINYCVVIVWLQSLQPHVPTPAAAAAPLWQSVPEKITSCSSSLHMPSSCFFYGRPRNLCASHLHPSATILASVNWVCSPIPCLLAGSLLGLVCMYWAGGSQSGCVLPAVLLCGQGARSHGFVQDSLSCLAAHWRQTLLWSSWFPHFREEALCAWTTGPCFLLDIAVEMTPAPLWRNP